MRRNLLRVRSIFAPRPGFATLGLAERQPRGHTDVVPHDPGQRREISFLFDLFAASHRVRALLGQTMADAGLRPDEYAIYSAVQVAGTLPITERDLVRALHGLDDAVRQVLLELPVNAHRQPRAASGHRPQ